MAVRYLGLHALRHGRPMCLVFLELLMTEGRTFLIEDHRQAIRLMLAQDLHEHGREPVDGVCLQALGVRQRRQRKEGPVDISAAVNEVEGGHGQVKSKRAKVKSEDYFRL